ncbi:MAG: SGNH/GDSL hydrolase family protein [Kiritimatiellae bacterium]|nr:SGNH/GDSL hydrolase family protein [Kiritimatiellia bacterium]
MEEPPTPSSAGEVSCEGARGPKRRLRARLGLALAAGLAALLVAELLLRLAVCAHAHSPRPLWMPTARRTGIEAPHPVRNHALIPGKSFVSSGKPPGFEFCVFSSVNWRGLHDDELNGAKQKGEKRVLVLGDSFVEARQVPRARNFCEQLERRLNEALRERVSVINAGVSSYSPILEYLFYARELVHLEPDVVLVVFFANDVFDDLRYSAAAAFDADGVLLAVPPGAPLLALRKTGGLTEPDSLQVAFRTAMCRVEDDLCAWSYLVAHLQYRTRARALNRLWAQRPKNDEFFILERDPDLEPAKRRGWYLTGRYLAWLHAACAANGARFLLTAAPIAAQVQGPGSHDHFFFSGQPSNDDRVFLQRLAAGLQVPYVDLLPALQKAGKGLYYSRDGHWTAKGHGVVADALYPYVRQALGESRSGVSPLPLGRTPGTPTARPVAGNGISVETP